MERLISSQDDVLRRWPRVTAHLIAESLGYFTPKAAANAILAFKRGRGFWCEWYLHMASYSPNGKTESEMVEVGSRVLRSAIQKRKFHKGFMSSYVAARFLVGESLKGNDPIFASWF
jgi:hypothetical protein